jgi:hypothetical protein
MAKNVVSTQIRMPASLHKRLAKEAEANRRSLNEEIVYRLEAGLVRRLDDAPELKKSVEEIVEELAAKYGWERKR